MSTDSFLEFSPDHGGTGFDAIFAGGRHRLLGRLPASEFKKSILNLAPFRDAYATIPREKWVEVDVFDRADPAPFSQIQNGCVGHAAAMAAKLTYFLQTGEMPPLSPTIVYAGINGGKDDGAAIEDIIKFMREFGLCLESTFPESKYFPGQIDDAARAEASQYRLDDAYSAYTPDEVNTALQMGCVVVDSVMVGPTFNRYDGYGRVPVNPGPGNHAVCKAGMVTIDGRWYKKNINSWSNLWGVGGYFLTQDAHIASQSMYAAVVIKSMKSIPDDPFIGVVEKG